MANDYYGAEQSNDIKPLRERLREYYDESEFVTVMNIDTNPLIYQFTTPTDIETTSAYPGDKFTTMRRPPVRTTLEPGETRFCPAYEADLMIESLIKQITIAGTQNRVTSGEITDRQASTDWSDPVTQRKLIGEIFLGKQDLIAMANNQMKEPTAASALTSDVDKDLDFDEPAKQPARIGRPPKTA